MSRSLFSFRRVLGTAGVGLVLSAAAVPASAQQAAPQAAPQAEPQAAPAGDALTVTRDPVSGELRAATAAEQASLRAASQVQSRARIRVAAPRPQPKFHASGARGARVTDDMLTSSVAVRAPDGTIDVGHSPEEAAAKANARAQSHVANPVTE
jgi:hypothetical protein